MSLRTNVDALINPHLTTGPDGKPTRVPALLDQLAAAIQPSAGAKAGGGKGTLPINDHVLALQQDMEAEARRQHLDLTGHESGTLKGILKAWTTMELSAEWEQHLEHVTLDWCDRITATIDPPKVYRPNAPCPRCGGRFYGEERKPILSVNYRDHDGEILHPSQWTMTCSGCEAAWVGHELGHIAHAIQAA